jgi:hypothetical protein
VIYTLIGCASGERCVIERTENGFVTREENTSAANDWVPNRPRWEARIAATCFLTWSSAEAAERSRDRQDALAGWRGLLSHRDFDCVKPPYTRLAVTMSPAPAILRVAGYEMTTADLPEQVTQICEI